jgi:phenylacetic acid degradation operon negative regulatory protein
VQNEIRPLSRCDTLCSVHARSALFDLYGDHLLARGGWAPISATVGLLGSLGISAPAVRTAVSRMTREGWLEATERDGGRGYAATPRARARLAEAHARIYRTTDDVWDGSWHLIAVEHLSDRNARSRVAQALGYLGYGRLAADTWVAPRKSPEVGSVLAAERASSHEFTSEYAGTAGSLVAGVWDLEGLAAAYRRFADTVDGGMPRSDEEAFVERTELVHSWRLFLFSDPGLPAEVLPPGWPGHEAARLFDERAAALKPQASAWVDTWLGGGPA